MLNLRDFEAFVELADRLHFQDTADRLNISAATLSRIISRVEEQVGTRLFERTTRSVALTVAGQAFLTEAEQVLRQQQNAMRVGREIGLGITGQIKLGYGGVAMETFLPGLITRFREALPGVQVNLNLLPIHEQEQALLGGTLDVGFFCGSTRNSELTCRPCYRERLLLVMAADHPLSSMTDIRLADLEPFGFVFGKRDKWVSVYDRFLDSCNRQELNMRIELEADDVTSVMGLVAAGELLSLFPASHETMRRRGICWRSVTDFEDSIVVNAVHLRGNQNPVLQHWLDNMQE
ncbi:LysR family transcriptional regulator [Marinobacterium marinum]|uniref:LysR family transcriptional regulator n=1 Tax=Marinobacterium marinum TaxID=2756129 RepID=A0A7W2AB00_9GAMM|nr:LysR family transcriptional regulator [Marinobacterium marinum]MBA4500967.1 LysR family transcriptional regulator [Marinobacterium marinum]